MCNYCNSTLHFVVRLVNGPTEYEGRVEVYHNGVWGTVCGINGWNWNAAQVVCQEMGLSVATATIGYSYLYGRGIGQIWLDNVTCIGTELSIANCSHRGWGIHSCNNFWDVGVKCAAGKFMLLNSIKMHVCYIENSY